MNHSPNSGPRVGAMTSSLAPGLYLVATPIGTARDITLRALDVLASVDILAAEDTRTLRHLMEIHGIPLAGRPLWAVHDHNETELAPKILAAISDGKSIAYASEAGTPLVSDPGFNLARAVVDSSEGVSRSGVHAVPGASAVLAALTVAGLPTDRFLFAGFLPSGASERQRVLTELAAVQATIVWYESPRRIRRTLEELVEICGPERQAAVCRELTKKFEQTYRGSLAQILEALEGRDPKGEIVLLLDRAGRREIGEADIELALQEALQTMSLKEAASIVAQNLDVPRRVVYQMGLARKDM